MEIKGDGTEEHDALERKAEKCSKIVIMLGWDAGGRGPRMWSGGVKLVWANLTELDQ